MVFLKKQFYFQFTKWWRIKKLNHFFFKFHVNMGLWWCETRFFKRNHQLPSNTTKFIFCKKFIFCNFTHIYDNLIWWKLIFCANWFLVIFPWITTKFTIFCHLHTLTLPTEKPSHFMGFLYISTLFQKFEMYTCFKLIFSYFSLNQLKIYNFFISSHFELLTLKPTEEWC